MTLLMVNIVSSIKDYVVNKCITNNVGVYSGNNTDQVHKYLTTTDVTHIFIDLVSKTVDWMDFLKQLRESEDGNKYQVIVISNRKEREFIQSLLYLGIVGFIPSGLGLEKTFERLDKILKITEKRDPRRKHFRVKIPTEVNFKLNFRLPNQDKLITGSVTDLSIVAIAFKLDTAEDLRIYTEGTTIEKVQLKIRNKFILVTIKILKAGPVTIAGFLNLKENALNSLSQYIFEEMSNAVNKITQS